MTAKLITALYIGLVVSMIALAFGNFMMMWVLFAFFFFAVFGGLFIVKRPQTIVIGFLIVSLIVLGAGLFSKEYTVREGITILVGLSMSTFSAFTLFWMWKNPPELPVMSDIVNRGYGTMNEQEFLHQVSVDTNVSIELLKDLYHNDELLSHIKVGKIIEATKLVRSTQPIVDLMEAKMVVEAFAERQG